MLLTYIEPNLDFIKVNQKRKNADPSAYEESSRPPTPSPVTLEPSPTFPPSYQTKSSIPPPNTTPQKSQHSKSTSRAPSKSPTDPRTPSPTLLASPRNRDPRIRAAVARRDERCIVTNISEDMCITSHVIPAAFLSVLSLSTDGGLTKAERTSSSGRVSVFIAQ